MKPIEFMQKGEILLGGFHVGSDIGTRWDRYEQEEKVAKLTNTVDDTGFERRIISSEGIQIFTGVEVTDKNILPNYDLLVIPPSYYSVFEINCNADIEQQFKEIDVWLDNNKGAYKRTKWDNENEDYIIIWSGRYVIEKICEVWVSLENMLEGDSLLSLIEKEYEASNPANA